MMHFAVLIWCNKTMMMMMMMSGDGSTKNNYGCRHSPMGGRFVGLRELAVQLPVRQLYRHLPVTNRAPARYSR